MWLQREVLKETAESLSRVKSLSYHKEPHPLFARFLDFVRRCSIMGTLVILGSILFEGVEYE